MLSQTSDSASNQNSSDPAAVDPTRRRDRCNICNSQYDLEKNESALVPCHVSAFLGREFRIWRCDRCHSLHCLDVVDLDHYYSKYPFAEAKLDLVWRIFYRNLARRFIRHGMTQDHKFLDYGCANGLFCRALRERGFSQVYGYDPYSASQDFNDPAALQHGPFDYILLQDVLEHVESPIELLTKLNDLLLPGGHILVGTPNAERIDLSKGNVFRNELHAPYHLHIPTREAVESMGRELGWTPVAFYDRSYHDRPWFGMNTRAVKVYQTLKGGTFDALFGPFDLGRAMRSPSWWFYAVFGYWLSYKSDLSVMFQKPK